MLQVEYEWILICIRVGGGRTNVENKNADYILRLRPRRPARACVYTGVAPDIAKVVVPTPRATTVGA